MNGNRGAFVEQRDGSGGLRGLRADFRGDGAGDGLSESCVGVCHCLESASDEDRVGLSARGAALWQCLALRGNPVDRGIGFLNGDR